MNRRGQPCALGIDIGGTKIELVVIDQHGERVDRYRTPTKAEGPRSAVMDRIADTARTQLSGSPESYESMGVGVAGLVDRERGHLHVAPNLSWADVPLGEELSSRFGGPVTVMNDVDAATWGEWKHGAGKGVQDIVTVFLGTGIGTGVVTGGRLLEGHGSSAAELGHVPIVAGGRSCTAPHAGCIEAYAGGWAIGERAREAAREDPERGSFLREAAGSVRDITARHVSQGVRENDPLSRELRDETGRLLGIWAIGVMNVFSPARIIMGGSVLEGLPELQTMMEDRIQSDGFAPHTEGLEVVRAELDESAPAIGAAAFARDRAQGAVGS